MEKISEVVEDDYFSVYFKKDEDEFIFTLTNKIHSKDSNIYLTKIGSFGTDWKTLLVGNNSESLNKQPFPKIREHFSKYKILEKGEAEDEFYYHFEIKHLFPYMKRKLRFECTKSSGVSLFFTDNFIKKNNVDFIINDDTKENITGFHSVEESLKGENTIGLTLIRSKYIYNNYFFNFK
mgnify:CR=1 FL=1